MTATALTAQELVDKFNQLEKVSISLTPATLNLEEGIDREDENYIAMLKGLKYIGAEFEELAKRARVTPWFEEDDENVIPIFESFRRFVDAYTVIFPALDRAQTSFRGNLPVHQDIWAAVDADFQGFNEFGRASLKLFPDQYYGWDGAVLMNSKALEETLDLWYCGRIEEPIDEDD